MDIPNVLVVIIETFRENKDILTASNLLFKSIVMLDLQVSPSFTFDMYSILCFNKQTWLVVMKVSESVKYFKGCQSHVIQYNEWMSSESRTAPHCPVRTGF